MLFVSATVLVFGALLLAAGIAQLVQAFSSRSDSFGWELLCGAVYTAAGLLLILEPAGGALGLTIWIALFFLFACLLRLSLGLRARRLDRGGGLFVALGALDLLLALLILSGLPGSAAWVIGVFVGIELVCGGSTLVLTGIHWGRIATT